MKRQLKKQGLAKQWKHTQRQRAQQPEGGEERQQEQPSTRKRRGKANAATATAPLANKKQKADQQPALTSSSTRFFSLLSDPTTSSSSSSLSSTIDAVELQYLEEKLGLSSSTTKQSKLRREMAEDGLDELFELVEGIETGMTDAQKRRVAREEGIGEEEYQQMMAAAHEVATAGKQRKRHRAEEEAVAGMGEDESDDDGEQSGEEENDDQLMPEPDEDEMERYYREDEEKEGAEEQAGLDDEDDEQDEQDEEADEAGQADEVDNSEDELEKAAEDEANDDEVQDRPPHRKLTRDELYGFNAPTPQSLINFRTGEQTSTASSTAAPMSTSAPGKYIPPHLRNKAPIVPSTAALSTASSSLLSTPPADAALLPRITGLLNRLNEQNVEPITSQLLPLFDAHSRSAVNNTLTVAVLTQLVGGTAASLSSTFVLSVSGMLFLLHYTEEHGTVAYLLEHTLLTLRNVLSSASTAAASPSLTAAGVNVVDFLCHLYLFSVTSSTALFDLLNLFSSTLTSLHIELLATILGHTGSHLRKQDPAALKDVVVTLHRTAAQLTDSEREGRVGYLLQLVNDVKNNRVKQHAVVDAMAPLHNALLNVVKRRMGKRVGYDESRRLTFGYEDVRRIGERGRWWIVGAAFKGAGENEQQERPADKRAVEPREEESVVDEEGDINYVQLARQQGYHLPFDIRVFCILLSSVDYLQAVEALDKLNIRQGSQWRSVISILIDCVRRSRTYNPYFALVTVHLCQYVRPVRFTVQLALWDTFTALAGLPSNTQPPPTHQANNVGQYIGQLLQSAYGPTVWTVWRHVDWSDDGDGDGLYGVMLECVRTAVEVVLASEGRRGEEAVRFVFGGGKRGQDVVVDEETKGRRGGNEEEEERVRDGLSMFLERYVKPAEARKSKKKDERAEQMSKRAKIAKEALADAL